ncbi:MAG: GNAT family N-acetyltransferase [Pseudomonadota bacterium]
MGASTSWHIAEPGEDLRAPIMALLPRLAAFELPPKRNPKHLWEGDAALLERWFDGEAPNVRVLAATDDDSALAGAAMLSLRPELLSHEPSAHLEALAVSPDHEGRGVGSALLDACHARARDEGARSITLHVFDTNQRARQLYQRKGYTPELRRCIKWL